MDTLISTLIADPTHMPVTVGALARAVAALADV
jgi:hypothetical protein